MRTIYKLFCPPALVIIFVCASEGHAATMEQEVIKKLNFIRSIETTEDKEKLQHYNKNLDEAWHYFQDNSDKVLPILQKHLTVEAGKDKPSQFLLLDIGFFLYMSEEPQLMETGKKAFYKIDPHNAVISANLKQLFEFAHQVAANKDAKILPYLDNVFLKRDNGSVFMPQHALTLDKTLMNVFLYGAYGAESENHLQKLLQDNIATDSQLSRSIVELLIWIGTDKSLPQVKKLMETQHDYDTFVRCVAYFMQTGGTKGQQIMQKLNANKLDAKSREYYQQIKDEVSKPSFAMYQKMLSEIPGEQKLENSVVKTRLKVMYDNFGKDNETHPLAILNADLPKQYLIDQLVKIRSRMLYRLSDEALSDVKITNTLINALHYRNK